MYYFNIKKYLWNVHKTGHKLVPPEPPLAGIADCKPLFVASYESLLVLGNFTHFHVQNASVCNIHGPSCIHICLRSRFHSADSFRQFMCVHHHSCVRQTFLQGDFVLAF